MKTEKISTGIWLALWRKTEAYGCIQMEEQPDPCQYVSDIRSFAITAVQFGPKNRLLCSAIRQKFEFWAQSLEKSGCIYVPVEKFLEFAAQPGIFLLPIVLTYAQGKCTRWESGYFRQDIKKKMTMIAYHYSVTYQGDKSLQNDFRKNYQRSEPYIRALENGNGVFTAMLLLSMYKDRVLKSEKEGMYEYAKDARVDLSRGYFALQCGFEKAEGWSTPLGCKTAQCRASVKDSVRKGETDSLMFTLHSATHRKSSLPPRRAHDCRRQYHCPLVGGE